MGVSELQPRPGLSRNVLLEETIFLPLKVARQSKGKAGGFTPPGLLPSWLGKSVRCWKQPECILFVSACVTPIPLWLENRQSVKHEKSMGCKEESITAV